MYTRNYFNEGNPLPESYDGIAMLGQSGDVKSDAEDAPVFKSQGCESERPKQPILKSDGLLGGLFGNLHLGLPSLDKIGYEEILIIAVAAFLFFSDGGDKECAVILILLLLIN